MQFILIISLYNSCTYNLIFFSEVLTWLDWAAASRREREMGEEWGGGSEQMVTRAKPEQLNNWEEGGRGGTSYHPDMALLLSKIK